MGFVEKYHPCSSTQWSCSSVPCPVVCVVQVLLCSSDLPSHHCSSEPEQRGRHRVRAGGHRGTRRPSSPAKTSPLLSQTSLLLLHLLLLLLLISHSLYLLDKALDAAAAKTHQGKAGKGKYILRRTHKDPAPFQIHVSFYSANILPCAVCVLLLYTRSQCVTHSLCVYNGFLPHPASVRVGMKCVCVVLYSRVKPS